MIYYLIIRQLRKRDYQSFAGLFEEAYFEYLESLKDKHPEQYQAELKEKYMRKVTRERFDFYLRTRSSFVAEKEGKVVGYVASQAMQFIHGVDSLLWIEYIVIQRDFRRQGIGQALLQKLQEHAKLSGINRIYTTINPDNDASIALHRKSGFHIQDWKIASYKTS